MDDWLLEYVPIWNALTGAARETLICLCKRGPTWDGDVPSKSGRDELLKQGLAAKIVLKGNEQGYQAATYKGSQVFRAGYVEPRKAIVSKLVGREHVRPGGAWR
jgi:hypothetical protein